MILPAKDSDGRYFVSYSQVASWNETKGFNTGMLGRHEYIKKYFLKETFEDKYGFATFGKEVEDYITTRGSADKFTADEKAVLETIIPLGKFQQQFKLEYPEFYVLGYRDDCNEEFTKIRDYKTASKNSAKKYYEDGYYQLDIYAMAMQQKTGKLPELEVCVIERLGNGFRGGRDVMSVGKEVWYIPRTTNAERINSLHTIINNTVNEISQYYEVFLELNNKK